MCISSDTYLPERGSALPHMYKYTWKRAAGRLLLPDLPDVLFIAGVCH